MRRIRVLLAVTVVVLVTAGAAVVVRQSGGGSGSSGAHDRGWFAYCPLPETVKQGASPQDTPQPCASFTDAADSPDPSDPSGQDARAAENHAHRQEQPLTAAQRAAARPQADALAAELRKLAGTRTDEASVRTAAARALGLPASRIELRGDFTRPLTTLAVAGDTGQICVTGSLSPTGTPTTTITGRPLDDTCLPGPGGH